MKYRLIAFDLDGTILRDDKSLTARSFRALRAAAEAGALIVPATGRIYKGLPAPLRELDNARQDRKASGLAGLSLEDLEKLAIGETLRETGENKSETARRLGITRATLHNKLKRYGLE